MSVQLDKWDFQIIRICKQGVLKDQDHRRSLLRSLWAERCALLLKHVEWEMVVGHMLDLVDELSDKRSVHLVDHLIHLLSQKYEGEGIRPQMLLYEVGAYCMSALALLPVTAIPGYREWLDNQPKDQ